MLHFIRRAIIDNGKGHAADSVTTAERTRIAAAVILLEAAHADNECTDKELDHVLETLRIDFKISQEYAGELIELAHHERRNAVDLFEFTNHINSAFSKEEKRAILKAVWRIIFLDGQLEKHEDHFARKLTHLLRLMPEDMIAAKLQAKKEIE